MAYNKAEITAKNGAGVSMNALLGKVGDPVPRVIVQLNSYNGSAMILACPDTGADICCCNLQSLPELGESTDNLCDGISPNAIDGRPVKSVDSEIHIWSESSEICWIPI